MEFLDPLRYDLSVPSTPTSRKDATLHCPSSSRFIQEHFTLQCRNGNPPLPRTTLGRTLNTLLTPPNHLSHEMAVHRFTASDDTSGELPRHLRSAGGWDVAKSEVMRKSGTGHKTWQPSQVSSLGWRPHPLFTDIILSEVTKSQKSKHDMYSRISG